VVCRNTLLIAIHSHRELSWGQTGESLRLREEWLIRGNDTSMCNFGFCENGALCTEVFKPKKIIKSSVICRRQTFTPRYDLRFCRRWKDLFSYVTPFGPAHIVYTNILEEPAASICRVQKWYFCPEDEAKSCSETLVYFWQTIRRHIPHDSNFPHS
jgi:hypothetical protein